MALNPSFISTPRLAIATYTGPGANPPTIEALHAGTAPITTVIQGVTAGTRILQIDAQFTSGVGSAGSLFIYLSLDNGNPGSWKLFDIYPVTTVATISLVAPAYKYSETYNNLILPNTSARLGVSHGYALAPVNVIVFGGDLT